MLERIVCKLLRLRNSKNCEMQSSSLFSLKHFKVNL